MDTRVRWLISLQSTPCEVWTAYLLWFFLVLADYVDGVGRQRWSCVHPERDVGFHRRGELDVRGN